MFKKKLTTVVALALIMVVLFAAGVTAGATNGSEVVSRTINVASFDRIIVAGNWDVVFVEAASHSIRVEMPAEWFDRYNFNVVRDTLRVERNLRSRQRWDAPARPLIYVYAPSLEGMSLSGSADATSSSVIRAEDFRLNVSGNASANLNFNVSGELTLNATGRAEVTMSGTTRYLTITGAGINSIHAFDLDARYARNVLIAGLGVVEVTAIETLNVRVGGFARVYYRGNPTITQRTTGSGRLIDAN